MRPLAFTGVAILTAACLTGCGSGPSLTDESSPSLAADGDHNTADHFTAVEAVSFEIDSPCNSEAITFSGTAESQVTLVDTREHLDNGNAVHTEFQQHTTATGTGSVTGATYTIDDIYHESFQSPSPPAPQVTLGANGMTRVSSDIAGLSFRGHFVFKAVIPPGQDFKVTTSLEAVTCS